MRPSIKCQQCGGTMIKTKKVDTSLALQLLGVVLFLVGVVLLFLFPIGTVAGIILMIGAARLGYKKLNIWKSDRPAQRLRSSEDYGIACDCTRRREKAGDNAIGHA